MKDHTSLYLDVLRFSAAFLVLYFMQDIFLELTFQFSVTLVPKR